MIFAISDMHGHYDIMKKRIDQILPYLDQGDSKLLLLGDFIDRGNDSFSCVKVAYDLQKTYGFMKMLACGHLVLF